MCVRHIKEPNAGKQHSMQPTSSCSGPPPLSKTFLSKTYTVYIAQFRERGHDLMNLSLRFTAFRSNLWIFDIYHDYFYYCNISNFSQNCLRIRGGEDTEYGNKITWPKARKMWVQPSWLSSRVPEMLGGKDFPEYRIKKHAKLSGPSLRGRT